MLPALALLLVCRGADAPTGPELVAREGEVDLEHRELEHLGGQRGVVDDDEVLQQPPIGYAMPLIMIKRTGGQDPRSPADTTAEDPLARSAADPQDGGAVHGGVDPLAAGA